MTSRNLLLICPQFFGYHESICEAADKIGWSSTWIDGRAGNSVLFKIGLKVAPKTLSKLSQRPILEKISEVKNVAFTDILIVKGDGLDLQTMHHLRESFPKATMTFYLWDSVENTKGAVEKAAICDRTLTFDAADASANGWAFRPLFSRIAKSKSSVSRTQDYSWSFVGSLHSDRHRIISKLTDASANQGHFVYLFVQNGLVKLLRS